MLKVLSVEGTGVLSSGSDLSDTSNAVRLLTPLPKGDKESFPFVLDFERDGEGTSA